MKLEVEWLNNPGIWLISQQLVRTSGGSIKNNGQFFIF